MRRAVHSLVALLLAPGLALASAPASGYTSCRQRAPGPAFEATPAAPAAPRASPTLAGSRQEAADLEEAVRRFDEEGRAYRGEVQTFVKKQFDERRRFLADHYEQAISNLEVLERNERDSAIIRFEEFLSRYPDDPQYTPDAMFRLAELYYEKANDDFRLASEGYRDEAKRALAEGREPPPEPMKSYAPSIALYQRLITGFPDYRFTHGIYYLLAYCLGEMGQGQEAQTAYQTLIERYPDSAFVAEAWVRLGDWHFDEVAADSLQKSAQAFSKMYAFPDHPLYARAIYKLGWTYYRMDDFQNAVESFTRLLDHYVGLAKTTGEKPSGDVWPEAVQYTAISFADEKWGGVRKARDFYASLGGRSYEPEIFTRLGEVYFEETKYAQAVEAYKVVLERDPLSPDAPRIQS
ncbi:MAG: tetratricopeptide repeat protein, partial [Anaeromyxobacteraceae bacterium]|nr:tetratricopeptide repeat protein [Anaeromyxobacteraceae bacterium]